MTMTNGQPGETPSILIRGISSMSAKTDPLIVLDGMPYEGGWNNINPADVESISVLKMQHPQLFMVLEVLTVS